MTDQVSAGVPARRTRRQLLAGGTAALAAALTAEALTRVTPALADSGQAVLQGEDNGTPTARPAVVTANEVGVLADPGDLGLSLGVFGIGLDFGMWGLASPGSGGTGVQGEGDGSGTGVIGTGGNGLHGDSGTGVAGTGGDGTGSAGGTGPGRHRRVSTSGAGGAEVAGTGGRPPAAALSVLVIPPWATTAPE